MSKHVQINGDTYTQLQINFINEYFVDYNATQAVKRAGYQTVSDNAAAWQGSTLLKDPKIVKLIRVRLETDLMTKEEVIHRLARVGRGADIAHYIEQVTDEETGQTFTFFDLNKFKADGLGFLVKSVTNQRGGSVKFDFYDALKALEILAKHHALLVDVLVNISDDVSSEKDALARRQRVTELLAAAASRARPADKSAVIEGTAKLVESDK